MSFLSILLIVLKVLLCIYLVVSVLATLIAFSIINETAVILAEQRPQIYEICGLKEFCEKPILLQFFPKCVIMGFLPVLNLANLVAYIRCKEDLVIDLANEFIEEYISDVVNAVENEAKNQETL